jgi:hypothetical protein
VLFLTKTELFPTANSPLQPPELCFEVLFPENGFRACVRPPSPRHYIRRQRAHAPGYQAAPYTWAFLNSTGADKPDSSGAAL